jgi:N-acyl-L-homoserine lactone synthetase
MRVVSGQQSSLPAGLYSQVAGYRHKVFVERLGWQLAGTNDRELDQFDRSDTVYVVAQDDDESIFGCARLLPTHRPYLLGEVFPHLMNGAPVPCDPHVWELSRFACTDLNNRGIFTSLKQFSESDTANFMHAVVRSAARHGARQLITVTWLGIERLIRRLGIKAHRAGPPVILDGQPIFACWIDIPHADAFEEVSAVA